MWVDFDGDDFIGSDDMKEIINRLIGKQELPEEQLDIIVQNVWIDYFNLICIPFLIVNVQPSLKQMLVCRYTRLFQSIRPFE